MRPIIKNIFILEVDLKIYDGRIKIIYSTAHDFFKNYADFFINYFYFPELKSLGGVPYISLPAFAQQGFYLSALRFYPKRLRYYFMAQFFIFT